jgi:hypothetical protein
MPNLIREAGFGPDGVTHLELLDGCLRSCGVDYSDSFRPARSTAELEEWFFSVFASRNVYTSLCVLGPGTEAVSNDFLGPLERAVKKEFGSGRNGANLAYFDAHSAKNEDEDAKCILLAMHEIERNSPVDLSKERATMVRMARTKHQQFWDSLAELKA